MKTAKLLISLFLITFISCDREDTYIHKDTSIIKFEVLETTPLLAYPEDTLKFSLKLISEKAIKTVSATLDGVEVSNLTLPASTTETNYTFKYVVKKNEVGKTLNFVINAVSDDDKESIKEYLVYVQSPKAEILITLPANKPDTIIFNDTLEFNVSVVSGLPLKSIKTYLNNSELTSLTKETFVNPKRDNYHFSYIPTLLHIGQELKFTFEVMDVYGKIQTADYLVKVIRGNVILDINEYYDIKLGAQNCTDAGQFLNTTTGEVYPYLGVASICETIDLVAFYSGSTRAYNIASPSKESVATFVYKTGDDAMINWKTRNYTAIKMLESFTVEDFSAIDNFTKIQTLFDNAGVESDTSTGLKDGSVFTFKTAKGKFGIIIIKSRSANANTGYMVLDMKIQK